MAILSDILAVLEGQADDKIRHKQYQNLARAVLDNEFIGNLFLFQ